MLLNVFLIWLAVCEINSEENQDLDLLCRNNRDCTIQVNESFKYECIIGRKAGTTTIVVIFIVFLVEPKTRECETLKLKHVPKISISTENFHLFPFLSFVSIEKKIHHSGQINAFNFSFQLPYLSFGEGGLAQAVLAEFKDTHTGSFYHEPVCRAFDLSRSLPLSADFIREQTLTLASDCLGLDIMPSVFILKLTTVPTNHTLQYVVKWPEEEEDTDDHDVWVRKLIAVAAVSAERMVHVVFQSLKETVSMVEVKLMKHHGVIRTQKLSKGENRVSFFGVDDGQYWVEIIPRSNECENGYINCVEFKSEYFAMESSVNNDTNDIILFLFLILLLPILFILVLILLKHGTCCHREKRILVINSVVSHDLEEKISEKFKHFLSETLKVDVNLNYCYSSMTKQFSRARQRTCSDEDLSCQGKCKLTRCSHQIDVSFASTVHCVTHVQMKPTQESGVSYCMCMARKDPDVKTITVIFSTHPPDKFSTVSLCADDVTSTEHLSECAVSVQKEFLRTAHAVSLCDVPKYLSCSEGPFYLPEDIEKFLLTLHHPLPSQGFNSLRSKHWISILQMFSILGEQQQNRSFQLTRSNRSQSYMTVSIDDNCSVGQDSVVHRSVRRLSHLQPCCKIADNDFETYSNITEAEQELLRPLGDSVKPSKFITSSLPLTHTLLESVRGYHWDVQGCNNQPGHIDNFDKGLSLTDRCLAFTENDALKRSNHTISEMTQTANSFGVAHSATQNAMSFSEDLNEHDQGYHTGNDNQIPESIKHHTPVFSYPKAFIQSIKPPELL